MKRRRSVGFVVLVTAASLALVLAVIVLLGLRWRRDEASSRAPATGDGGAGASASPSFSMPGPGRPTGDSAAGPGEDELAGALRKVALARTERICASVGAADCAALTDEVVACIAAKDKDACLRAAERFARPPRMAKDRHMMLSVACRASPRVGCERYPQLDAWYQASQRAAQARADGEEVVADPARQPCADGDLDACWTLAYWHLDGAPYELEIGLRLCEAGDGRACRDVARASRAADDARRALERGCAHGDVVTCKMLYSALVHDGICAPTPVPDDPLDRHDRIACGPIDLRRAAEVAARIASLTGAPYVHEPIPPIAADEEGDEYYH